MFKTKIKPYLTQQRLLALAGLGVLIAVSLGRPLGAQSPFTQGYDAGASLQRGIIVQLDPNDASKVEPVSAATIEQMHGVVVDPNDAPATLSEEGKKVFVATSGRYAVLVSNQNGPIKTGDYLTISALSGIGMKAGTQQPMVVGRALGDFDGSVNVVTTTEINNEQGASQKVRLGYVQADILVARNPLLKSTEAILPDFLKRTTETVAGKPVSLVRVYLSLVIFLASVGTTGMIIYSGVRSGIISIGRNPLSKQRVMRGMLQAVLAGLIIFITGLLGVYLVLKL